MIICSCCGRDIDAIGQDNVSYTYNPLCEDCCFGRRERTEDEGWDA